MYVAYIYRQVCTCIYAKYIYIFLNIYTYIHKQFEEQKTVHITTSVLCPFSGNLPTKFSGQRKSYSTSGVIENPSMHDFQITPGHSIAYSPFHYELLTSLWIYCCWPLFCILSNQEKFTFLCAIITTGPFQGYSQKRKFYFPHGKQRGGGDFLPHPLAQVKWMLPHETLHLE